MKEYLLFQLYGPMQSWGDVAVGEIRPDSRHPTKSAVLGLLAGALGIPRDEDETHIRMAEAYGIAVRQDMAGVAFRDYHTVQTASTKRGRTYRCRADFLWGSAEGLNTIVTYRDYLADAGFGVCLWERVEEPPFALSKIADALRHPFFVPYLGRKCCPVGLPFDPHLVEADNIGLALDMLPVDGKLTEVLYSDSGDTVEVSWDRDVVDDGIEVDRIEVTRDIPVSRKRWLFTTRDQCVGTTREPKHREW